MDKNQHDERGRFLEQASVEASHAGIKALLLLNGGACVAMLGFIASVYTHNSLDTDRAHFLSEAIRSLVFFASAAGLSVVASLLSYLANQSYATAHINPKEHDRYWWRGDLWTRLGIGVVLLSMLLFGAGVLTLWLAA